GMVYDPESLEGSKAHYIACLEETSKSLSLVDMTTGESIFFEAQNPKDLVSLLEVLPIAEMVTNSQNQILLKSGIFQKWPTSLHEELATEHKELPTSALRLLSYVKTLKSDAWEHLRPFEKRELEHRMHLSATTLRHLEIFSTYRGEDQGSLFQALQRTKTSGGSRLLRQWLQFPLRDLRRIEERLDRIQLWRESLNELKEIREQLSAVGDLERRLGKVSQPQSQARDLLSLSDSLESSLKSLKVIQRLYKINSEKINSEKINFDITTFEKNNLESLYLEIQKVFVEDPPLTTKQGFMIRKGLFSELDEYIDLSTKSHEKIAEMEAQERELMGIPSLKIRYNNVFGFYIEITNTHKDKAPARYQRKQTLSNAERFCTPELIELEKKVLTAQTRRFELEFEIYENVKKKTLSLSKEILELSHEMSHVDVITSLSWLSLEENYVRPQWSKEDFSLHFKANRHPVVEQVVRNNFVANDIHIPQASCMILTGPNMAGKSTLMRQVALTAIMAQMGCYVPATEAKLPIFDAIYTRIGASDQLTEGLSTFMVEMTETAEMLQRATPQSLLILDEVGRGTSTFDGLCLAQGILEYVVQKIKAITLFATHYHELTHLEKQFSQIQNAHMNVVEKGNQIRFLHSLVQGVAGKSYGIHVAELAGIPPSIISHAKVLLERYEQEDKKTLQSVSPAKVMSSQRNTSIPAHQQLSMFEN
ncbi:MAG TPA: DNA mismatch repair protein MutS, partial [Pseudobdellovibrionaceae bacterium]|nr:DNA mismatch repair protein MutS [Pseudobdellovibrionaceae bacterium]